MKHYFQSILISLLMSSSFLAQAADDHDPALEQAMAESLGMSVSRYRIYQADQKSSELARQLQAEEDKNNQRRLEKEKADEKASREYIRRLQEEEQMRLRQEEQRKEQLLLREKGEGEKASRDLINRIQLEDQIKMRQ